MSENYWKCFASCFMDAFHLKYLLNILPKITASSSLNGFPLVKDQPNFGKLMQCGTFAVFFKCKRSFVTNFPL